MQCVSEIAGSIQLNCAHPLEGGYTGRAVLIPVSAISAFTRDAQNPRIVTAVTLVSGAKTVLVDNEGITPFDGSSSTGNNDTGFVKFVKAVAMKLPERGAEFAAKVLEPLVKSGRGFVGIFEKTDRVGDGTFEMIGVDSPLKVVDPSTVTRSETTDGGAWAMTMQSSEYYAETVLFDTDYATSLAKFEALLAQAY